MHEVRGLATLDARAGHDPWLKSLDTIQWRRFCSRCVPRLRRTQQTRCSNMPRFFLLPPASLARYHEKKAWAPIARASAGVGFDTARELAARVFQCCV
ncbi:hypothetical protein F4779DRAFT_552436 [Xylariaceae sp. FL0662B]|nr:hypothetical protein F4779DRAFT_552436 [Xylariaceae sp. FL0662B]